VHYQPIGLVGVKILSFAKKYAPCEVSQQNYLKHFFTKGKILTLSNLQKKYF